MVKKVPVTSVTPASKVKATSKAQQARTRNLVMGIASATPVGRVVKVAGKTASKVIGNTINKKTRRNYLDGVYYTDGLEPGIKAARNARKVANSFEKPIKAEAKANARGLKAANKPTNKTGTAADRAQRAKLQGNANLIKNASPARANRTRGGSLAAQKTYGGFGVATAKRTPAQIAYQAEITQKLNPVRIARRRVGKSAKKK